ncbi:MAG: PHB depolymerase family esterase [Candidatus Thiodiazotropha sp.]
MGNRSQIYNKFTRLHNYLLLALLLFTSISSVAERQLIETHSVVVDGNERSYIVYKPIYLPPNPPLMLVLHGGLGNAQAMQKTTHMDRVADKHGFIVVYANGVAGRLMKKRRTWNAGACCGKAVKTNANDVGYLEEIITEMASKYHIDTKRVYITGFSNGAMMAYRMACERPEKVAAIVPVSGTLAVNRCDGVKDVPVLHIHGDLDDNVPFRGGKGGRSVSGVNHKSVDETLNIVKKRRQCTLTDTLNQSTNIQVKKYVCKNGLPVVLYTVHNGGHEWPEKGELSASETVWNFVKSHSK